MLHHLRSIALCACLTACAAPVGGIGNPIPIRVPQAAEQCQAQPDLE